MLLCRSQVMTTAPPLAVALAEQVPPSWLGAGNLFRIYIPPPQDSSHKSRLIGEWWSLLTWVEGGG